MELVATNNNSHPHPDGTSSVPSSENSQEIGHIQDISDMISNLSLNDESSDMVLIVQNERIAVHKVILAAHSKYFRSLFYGNSNQNKVELHDDNVVAFKCLLKYIYCGKIWTKKLKEDLFLDILELSHKYEFQDLENNISDNVRDILTVHNACYILDFALFRNLRRLKKKVLSFICYNAKSIIAQNSFYNLSKNGLIQIIQRTSFYAPEIEIFKAVQIWVEENSMDIDDEGRLKSNDINIDEILPYVRLSLISLPELMNSVRSNGIISADKIWDAIELQRNDKVMLRGYFKPEKNVATTTMGAFLLHGEISNSTLNCYYATPNENTLHTINNYSLRDQQIILIKLGTETIVNHIKLLLWAGRYEYTYSYYIEVSIDEKNWFKIIDYSRYHCRRWQYLYFKTEVVQYVRIVGYNNECRPTIVESFEIMYTNEPKDINDNGIIIPKYNVATKFDATVVATNGYNSGSLLDENIMRYVSDSECTHHLITPTDFGDITIQLGQPYMLESACFILFDSDDRTYSYYVEVTSNHLNWEKVVDHTQDLCKGYQLVTFTKRPVLSIRIVGTYNSTNKFFHCVYFECPAQVKTKDKWSANHNVCRFCNSSSRG